jgi:hypothetical protein
MSKYIDRPDEVAFAQEIANHLPSSEDKNKLIIGMGAAYILGKVVKNVRRK